jgi:hypothetical protein
MDKRLKYHTLPYTVIHGIGLTNKTPEFEEYIKDFISNEQKNRGPELGCLFSHISALRHFINQTDLESCLIMEDDALLHNDFVPRLNHLLKIKPKWVGAILLASYNTALLPYERMILPGLYEMWDSIFGMCCYWVDREYAQHALRVYDVPLCSIPKYKRERISSEYILNHNSGAALSFPPLAIEECLDTNIQSTDHLLSKRKYWSNYGYENYSCLGSK